MRWKRALALPTSDLRNAGAYAQVGSWTCVWDLRDEAVATIARFRLQRQ
jgi:hypothetical protein